MIKFKNNDVKKQHRKQSFKNLKIYIKTRFKVYLTLKINEIEIII